MSSYQFDDYRWLVDEADDVLEQAAANTRSAVQLAADLRRTLPLGRARLVQEQAKLRRRAAVKFPQADKMFFTRQGLQQATGHTIARYKAQRYAVDNQQIIDLCCGIGGDLLGLAADRNVVGVERDKVTALMATANLRHHALHAARVICADVNRLNLKGFAAWHCDPDRRPGGRRRSRPELYEPPVDQLLQRDDRPGQVAVKMAPAADVTHAWLRDSELEWIGHRRECKQLVAWFGDLARRRGQRVATVLAPERDGDGDTKGDSEERSVGEASVQQVVGHPSVDVGTSDGLLDYLFEPHAAVLAARLEGVLAAEWDLQRVAPGIAYFTGSQRVQHDALATFRVLAVSPYRQPQVKDILRSHGGGPLEIKMRGVAFDTNQVRKSLAVDGSEQLTLLLFPLGNSIKAVVAQRLGGSMDR